MGTVVTGKVVSIEVPVTQTGIVASVKPIGASVAIYTDVPPAWAAALAMLNVRGVIGAMRVDLVLAQPLVGGCTQAVNLPDGIGGIDSIELEIVGAPAVAPPMRVAIATWDGSRVALLEQMGEDLAMLRQVLARS